MTKLVLIVALLSAAAVGLAHAKPNRLQKDIKHPDENTPSLSNYIKPGPGFYPEPTAHQNGLTKNKRRSFLDKMGRDYKDDPENSLPLNLIKPGPGFSSLDSDKPKNHLARPNQIKRASRMDECQATGGICVRKSDCLAGGEDSSSAELCAGDFVCCYKPSVCRYRGGSCVSKCSEGIIDAKGKCNGNGEVCCVQHN